MNNPLSTSQREKSGANTFDKYEYQYHWALCKILDKQKNIKEYALFMEYHEDVVISNSLDKNSAKFEFNQVKNIKYPKYTIKNLTKRKNNKLSVLGKLVDSVSNKQFESSISTVNLIASCGFNIDQIDNDLHLETITVGDLSKVAIKDLKNALNKELGLKKVPDNLRFIIPDLGIQNQQDAVIGRVATLVSSIFPNTYCNAENIYRALIDELHRKGTVDYDYNNWNDLLEKKALTSTKVSQTISTHIKVQDMQEILAEASEISNELGYNYIKRKIFRSSIERIHIKIVGFPSSLTLKTRKSIRALIPTAISQSSGNVVDMLEFITDELPRKLKKDIGSNDNVTNHILYEIIVSK